MKHLAVLLVLLSAAAFAQDAANQFANHTMMLVSPSPDGVAVVPVINAQQKLEFVPVAEIQVALQKGATPIRYAALLELLATSANENQRLQAENERLWKLIDNGKPWERPANSSRPSDDAYQIELAREKAEERLERSRQQFAYQQMLMRNLVSHPIQPAPVRPVQQTNCTSNVVGQQVYTNCNHY